MSKETSEIKEALDIVKDKQDEVKLRIEGKEYKATLYPIDAEGAIDMLTSLMVEDKTANPRISQLKKMLFASPETIARSIQLDPAYSGDLTKWLKRNGAQYVLVALKVIRISDLKAVRDSFPELVGAANEMLPKE